MKFFFQNASPPFFFKKPGGAGLILTLVFLALAGAVGYLGPRFFNPVEYVSSKTSPVAPPRPRHLATPPSVRGIYMTSWVAGTKGWRDGLVKFIDTSELNSVVIDVKDYTGRVSFEVEDEKLKALGYPSKRIPDVATFIEELHQKNIYVIGRISVFQDLQLARMRPDLAVKRKSGAVWKDRKGLSWLDPAGKESWELMVQIAREAERAGFDELNFDYIRFPSDGNLSDIVYPFWDGKIPKAEIIKVFFEYLNSRLEDTGVPISVDIFGLTTWNKDDLNIGQILEDAARVFDYVSPMVYPSHYPPTFQGYKNPAQHPYEIIKTAMSRAKERLLAIGENQQKLRPWIQDFDLGANYDASMVRLEKQAVYDAGLSSWLSWDPANEYSRGAYDLENSESQGAN